MYKALATTQNYLLQFSVQEPATQEEQEIAQLFVTAISRMFTVYLGGLATKGISS
jgi:hypothetical protein